MVMACRDPMESMKPAPAQGTHLVNIQRKKLKPLFTDMFTKWLVCFMFVTIVPYKIKIYTEYKSATRPKTGKYKDVNISGFEQKFVYSSSRNIGLQKVWSYCLCQVN